MYILGRDVYAAGVCKERPRMTRPFRLVPEADNPAVYWRDFNISKSIGMIIAVNTHSGSHIDSHWAYNPAAGLLLLDWGTSFESIQLRSLTDSAMRYWITEPLRRLILDKENISKLKEINYYYFN